MTILVITSCSSEPALIFSLAEPSLLIIPENRPHTDTIQDFHSLQPTVQTNQIVGLLYAMIFTYLNKCQPQGTTHTLYIFETSCEFRRGYARLSSYTTNCNPCSLIPPSCLEGPTFCPGPWKGYTEKPRIHFCPTGSKGLRTGWLFGHC